jgi:hypothetical protein
VCVPGAIFGSRNGKVKSGAFFIRSAGRRLGCTAVCVIAGERVCVRVCARTYTHAYVWIDLVMRTSYVHVAICVYHDQIHIIRYTLDDSLFLSLSRSLSLSLALSRSLSVSLSLALSHSIIYVNTYRPSCVCTYMYLYTCIHILYIYTRMCYSDLRHLY